jgi:hypothetical protein
VTPIFQGCRTAAGKPNPKTAYPVVILDGANSQSVTDYTSADGRFQISRTYLSASALGLNANYGALATTAGGWRFDFEVEVHIAADGSGATIHLPDGSAYDFTRSGNSFPPTSGSNPQTRYRLAFVGTPPSDWTQVVRTATQWQLTDTASNQVWTLRTFNLLTNAIADAPHIG